MSALPVGTCIATNIDKPDLYQLLLSVLCYAVVDLDSAGHVSEQQEGGSI